MARRSISQEVRNQVVAAMREDGAKALEVSKRFGVSLPSVYNWTKAANASVTTTERVEETVA